MNEASKTAPSRRLERLITDTAYRAPLPVATILILLLIFRAAAPSFITRENSNYITVICNIVIFILPMGIYLLLFGEGIRPLRLRLIYPRHILTVISAMGILISGSMLISYISSGYGSLTSPFELYGAFTSETGGGAADRLMLIVSYALVPAVCEEFTFRAVLTSEYERRGSAAAVILPSLFFAMLHFDLAAFPVYFFSGVILSLTMYATRSVLGSFIVHFLYNLAALLGKPVVRTLYDVCGEGLFIFFLVSFMLLCGIIFTADCSRNYRYYADRDIPSDYRAADVKREEKNRLTEEPGTPLEGFVRRHPLLISELAAFFAPTAIVTYVAYFAVVLISSI